MFYIISSLSNITFVLRFHHFAHEDNTRDCMSGWDLGCQKLNGKAMTSSRFRIRPRHPSGLSPASMIILVIHGYAWNYELAVAS